jgi:hypothetical protein
LKRLRLVLDTELSPNNKTQGTGITVLIYIAGILSGTIARGTVKIV